jgi:hypothetical protein
VNCVANGDTQLHNYIKVHYQFHNYIKLFYVIHKDINIGIICQECVECVMDATER